MPCASLPSYLPPCPRLHCNPRSVSLTNTSASLRPFPHRRRRQTTSTTACSLRLFVDGFKEFSIAQFLPPKPRHHSHLLSAC
ncbi:hypothetical protein HPP92_011016 [Vanilla planifolia]|uniref:Uncharacterized protein n=1 Tax=Vanilla planifolia TaxID=51239 RepID=A0A835V2F7_VANPL|nr:hypothetical protein HPP92_011344 [Vanilla planifolia]KAG0482932.1 hypothetical protein HPP92_011016 [Vanilla planifolia]